MLYVRRIDIGIILFVSISMIFAPYYIEQAHPSKFSGGRPTKIIISEAGTTIFEVTYEDRKFNVTIIGQGIKSLEFSQEDKVIALENDGTKGVLEVEIPKELLDGEFTVIANNVDIEFEISETATHSILLFDKPDGSKTIVIRGTTVVPEFPVVVMAVLSVIVAIAIGISRFKKVGYRQT